MANTRISDLTASASNLASTDLAPVVQTAGVGPVKMTGAQIAAGLLSATTPIGSGPILSRGGSATLQLGAADAAAPVAQTLQVQSVVAGTSGNVAGANFTIAGSRGVGSGAGGSIIFQVAPAGTAGQTSQNAYATALTINSAQQALFANGSASAPSISFGTNTNTGFYRVNADQIFVSADATLVSRFTSVDFALTKDTLLGWSSTADFQTSIDVKLYRDAANTLALKNSTNPQIFRAYSTTTGPSYGYLAAGVTDAGVATADTLFIGTGGAGAAMTKLALVVNGTTVLDYGSTAASTWTSPSKIAVATSVAYPFEGIRYVDGVGGASMTLGHARGTVASPSNIISSDYVGNFVFSGRINGAFREMAIISVTAGTIGSSSYQSQFNFSTTNSNATSATVKMILSSEGLLALGPSADLTSSFPALKRSSTTLQVRLADDSAFAPIQGKLTTDTAYTAGAPTADGYLVLYDSNGTAYKVPCVAV